MTTSLDNKILFEQSLLRAARLKQTDPQFKQLKEITASDKQLIMQSPTSIEVLKNLCSVYADRPCLGIRRGALFNTISYAKLWERVEAIASGLNNLNLVKTGDFVGICAFSGLDFVLLDFACLYLGAVSVPLQTNLKTEDLASLINETELCALAVSPATYPLAKEVLSITPSIKQLILIENAKKTTPLPNRCQQFTLQTIENYGNKHKTTGMVIPSTASDPLVTLLYTSGSTGLPKGAMFRESLWIQFWKDSGFNQLPSFPLVALNFMPLNHMMGRGALLSILQGGGTLYFTCKDDMSTLFEDFQLVRPTLLYLVPRISEMLFQQYQLERLQNPNADPEKILNKMGQNLLGDRLIAGVTASAPTAAETLAFLKYCFKIPIFDCYGATESGVVTFEHQICEDSVSKYKIVDVPELGYFNSDKPYPRGELCVKTSRAISGYYKNSKATAAIFDPEGFIKTGDIVEERAANKIVCIDRVKNIQKLANGEFVTLWRLEGIFASGSSLIKQIYLYANSTKAYLLAVIVPDYVALQARFTPSAVDPNTDAIKHLLRQEIKSIAQANKLAAHEIPWDFIIESTPFTKEDNLLTESNKFIHANLKKKYSGELEKLYQTIESNQLLGRKNLQTLSGSHLSIAQKLKISLASILNSENIELSESSFKDLGGDSLSALAWSALIKKICAVDVPVSMILNPVISTQKILTFIENEKSTDMPPRISFASVHGKAPNHLKATDLQLEKFLTPQELKVALQLPPLSLSQTKNVFLTGANGFLGRFLVLALLEELAKVKGQLYCLVRASDDEEAYARLEASYKDSSHEIKERFRHLAKHHLKVLAGDLIFPKFALSKESYEKLAAEVDVIVHNGALVNHAFNYEQLFAPNVLGTVEVIKLALATRRKAIQFISSIAVPAGLQRNEAVSEEEDVRTLWPERPNGSGYAAGYANSKWAGEVLLRNAHEDFNIPVNIFRSGMILAHHSSIGEINATDFFTRILAGVINTGFVPQSFYRESRSKVAPFFDGLTVTFIASTVAKVIQTIEPSYTTYHVVNPEGNAGISFDVIFSWVENWGYPLKKISHYSTWYQTFAAALKDLPEKQKHHSPLPIIHQWQQPINFSHETLLDNQRFKRLALTLHADKNLSALPTLSQEFIGKCLKDMQHLGIIDYVS